MAGRPTQTKKAREGAERMAEIRKARRKAGFSEVTVWVPNEHVRSMRDHAWELIEDAGRSFPHQMTGPLARRTSQRDRQRREQAR